MNRRLPPPGGSGRSYSVNHNLIRQTQQRAEQGSGDSPEPGTNEYHYHQHFSSAPPAAVAAEPPRKSNVGLIFASAIGGIFFLLLLIAIASGDQTSEDVAAGGDDTAQAMLQQTHHYAEYRDGVYYYSSVVSDNARAEGVAVSAAVGYRYLGIDTNGDHVLAPVDAPGIHATCADPCRVIRLSSGETLSFTPDSVIGAAFLDAINGHLEQHPRAASSHSESDWDTGSGDIMTDAAAAAADADRAAVDAAEAATAAMAAADAAAIEVEAAAAAASAAAVEAGRPW